MQFKIGETTKSEFTITDANNDAVDLTGSTVRYVIFDNTDTLVYEEEITSFDNPTSGILIITIPKETTATFIKGEVKVQLDVLDTSDERDYSDVWYGRIIETLTV